MQDCLKCNGTGGCFSCKGIGARQVSRVRDSRASSAVLVLPRLPTYLVTTARQIPFSVSLTIKWRLEDGDLAESVA